MILKLNEVIWLWRHLQIIYEINRRFLEQTVEVKWPGQDDKKNAVYYIWKWTQTVRMAHLVVIGSHSVNGVAALHTDLLKRNLFHDFLSSGASRSI